jgi:hypothetical protein
MINQSQFNYSQEFLRVIIDFFRLEFYCSWFNYSLFWCHGQRQISSIRADRKNYWMRNRSPQDPGNGFQEVIYQRALAIEMKRHGIAFSREHEIKYSPKESISVNAVLIS